MKKQIAIALLIGFNAISCSTTKSPDNLTENNSDKIASILTNNVWTLTVLEGRSIIQSSNEAEKIHFSLNSVDQKVTGYAGCNTFNGNYILEKGNRIRFSKLASTRMACPDTHFNESQLFQVFDQVDNYTIQDEVLSLNVGRSAPLAIFNKAEQSDPIVEKYWKLIKLEGQTVTMAPNQEREVYFMLKNDNNRVTGFAGCNSMTGTYTLERGNRIRFSNMAGTLMLCPDVTINESEFFKVFELADNYTINGDQLSLNVGRRAPLAVFEAVYF